MTPVYILGVCAFTHDSSAALLYGSELVGFLEEDRLSGFKHTREFPELAVQTLLATARISPGDINAVAYTFDSTLYTLGSRSAERRPGPRQRRDAAVASYARISAQHSRTLVELRRRFPNATVVETPHHEAHAFSAIAAAGWRDAEVVVVDSIGEAATTSVGHWDADSRSLTLRTVGMDTDSLGYLYGAVTDHLGFRMRDEEGTVMALAAQGDPSRFRSLFAKVLTIDGDGLHLDPSYVRQRVFGDHGERLTARFSRETVDRRRPSEPLTEDQADLAAALQERTTDAFAVLCPPTRLPLRVISGGVATNCLAIGSLRRSQPTTEQFVPPAPGDSGTSLGAAAACLLRLQDELASIPPTPYWGTDPDLPNLNDPARSNLRFEPMRAADLARECARRLNEGQIVGVYRGAAEAGPRALGRRSIFADPRAEGVHHRLALRVKKRELFRPFAPIALETEASALVDLGSFASPYMSAALDARPELRSIAPVVVHSNGTARMQTVGRGDEPFVEELLAEFRRVSGSPVLINTSLNTKGSPTVGTWRDALDCLRTMDLDALVLGDDLVTRA